MSAFTEYTEPFWRGLEMRKLKVDEAYLVTKTFYRKVTYLYSLSEECYTCPYTMVKALHEHNNANITNAATNINVAHALKFKLFADNVGRYAFNNESSLCDFVSTDLQEFGVYNLTLFENGTCDWVTDNEGVNVNLSLLSVFILVSLCLIVLKISVCAWRSYRYEEILASAAANEEPVSAPTIKQRKRMRSLDVFRGLAIVLMIFVNSGGGDYWWIEHAPWNGLHLADIVFPSFLWIMGVCIPISIKSQLARGNTKLRICLRIIWRSLKLFTIGLCLNSINGPNLENLRIMGVLQRFGTAYLICGIVHTIFSQREHVVPPQVSWQRELYDLILFKGEICVMLALVIIHLSIVFGLDVPNCPKGYLGPGGKHNNAAYPNCIGGATGYIDLQILNNSHIYQHPTAKYIYDSKPFDPEGVFGCLLTVVQVMLGVLAGVIILIHTEWKARLTRWLLWSMVLTVLMAILSGFSKESGIIPLNKNLWSLSFVCATTALAFILLSVLYYIIDVRRWWTGYPFEACGMNAIVMYVGHTVMHKMLPWHWRIGFMNTHFILLLEAVWNTMLWIGIALYLDHIEFYYSL